MPTRSVLFTPGDEITMMRKSLESDADVLILDLEDAVALTAKDEARKAVSTVLTENSNARPRVWVRINPLEVGGQEDISSLATAETAPENIVVPMVDSIGHIQDAANDLDEMGLNSGIIAIIETAAGLTTVEEIATHPQLTGIIFGAEDFTADMGIIKLEDTKYLSYARSRVAVAGAAAAIATIDTVYTDIENLEGLRTDARQALNFGFDGKVAIHPVQLSVLNDVFTPSDTDITWAKEVLSARSEAGGKGVFELKGQMIDAPILSRAEEILHRAGESVE